MPSAKISIIIPVYNAFETLDELIDKCEKNIKFITHDYEIILIDDFSADESWKKIKSISEKNNFVKGYKLIRNFGVDTAITEGLKESSGDYVYIITCDVTDPLDQMLALFNKIHENDNIDLVCSYYKNKHPESLVSKIFSKIYWKLFSFMINEVYPVEEGLYRIISRRAVDIYLSNTNKFKHIKIMHIFGIKKEYIPMEQGLRKFGTSGFNLKKKIEFAIDYITTYSYKPLIYSSMFGFLLSVLFLFIGGVTILTKLLGYINVSGWASVIVFTSFLSSILFLNLAIIGIYLSRNIEETKESVQKIIGEKT
jgi:glycosyltransferase involved in cell wall biosynthesis